MAIDESMYVMLTDEEGECRQTWLAAWLKLSHVS
jgi:hypothetical protein